MEMTRSTELDPMAVQKFAVFDFDGTILDGHSPVMLVMSLWRSGLMGTGIALLVGLWGLRYKLRLPVEQSEVRQRIFNIFQGMPALEVDHIMEKLYEDTISKHLRSDALREISFYQKHGVPVIIVSASFDAIVSRAAIQLGAFAQISTKMKVEDGCYTGVVAGPPIEGEEKLRAFEDYADGLCGKGGWEVVAAYGDHHSDIPLLKIAQRHVAVDPDRKLKRYAKRNGWEIANWR